MEKLRFAALFLSIVFLGCVTAPAPAGYPGRTWPEYVTACHEAGHALVTAELGMTVEEVVVKPGRGGGSAPYRKTPRRWASETDRAWDQCTVAEAGVVAGALCGGHDGYALSHGDSEILKYYTRVILDSEPLASPYWGRGLLPDEPTEDDVAKECVWRAASIIGENTTELRLLRDRLLAEDDLTLDEEEFAAWWATQHE